MHLHSSKSKHYYSSIYKHWNGQSFRSHITYIPLRSRRWKHLRKTQQQWTWPEQKSIIYNIYNPLKSWTKVNEEQNRSEWGWWGKKYGKIPPRGPTAIISGLWVPLLTPLLSFGMLSFFWIVMNIYNNKMSVLYNSKIKMSKKFKLRSPRILICTNRHNIFKK